jgi:FkbM family methyltransferase
MEKIKRTLGFIFTHPLAKRHRFRSLGRFFAWQLQCILSPDKFIVKDYMEGLKFYARKGLTGITGNIYCGLHEFTDMSFLLHFLRQDDVFFDVGANVGSYTLLASGVCGSKSIAIEPVPKTFGVLKNNIDLNNLSGAVSLINGGAAGQPGTLSFSSNDDTTNHVIATTETAAEETIEVEVITIDSLLMKTQPALIKIDVEGYETEVLKGMSQTLVSPTLKAVIIELNGSGERYGFDERLIHNVLLSHDFQSFTYDPFQRLLTSAEPSGNNNTIYCRDIDFVNSRLKAATGINVMGEVI